MNQKWNLQDIRPANTSNTRRPTRPESLDGRNVHPPQNRPTRQTSQTKEVNDESFHSLPSVPVIDGKRNSRFKIFAGIFCVVLIIVGAIGISTLQSGAVITLYPKHRTITVNSEFIAQKERAVGELSYEVLSLQADGERQVTATGQEEVTVQATGIIDIYNTGSNAERLIKNTRFRTPDGLVFRITESALVPPATTIDGRQVPGRTQAEVFADQSGQEYNIPAETRMDVPGYQENNLTDLYNSIYAINPSAFTNGFSGPRFIINEQELATARQELQQELRNELLEKIQINKPAGFTVFENAASIVYTELPAVQYGGDLVTIKERAELQIPLFQDAEFASFIAQASIVGFDLSRDFVRIENPEELRFTYVDPSQERTSIKDREQLEFKIVGNPKIVWTYDEADIRSSLLGKEQTAHVQVFGKYPGIERSEINIRPFWSRTFPSSADKIQINESVSTN